MFVSPRQPTILCARCIARGRRALTTDSSTHSTSTSSQTTPPPPPASGAAKLTNRRLICLHGRETPKFLQGIVTNNIRPQSTTAVYAAFLTAQGKVLNDVFIYPTLGSQWHTEKNGTEDPGYLVEVDADQAPALLAHLKRHKLRSKFKLRLLDQGELDVWSAWKEQDKWTPHPSLGSDTAEQATNEDTSGLVTMLDSRAPGMGRRILLPESSALRNSHPMLSDLEDAPLSAYNIRRYMRGVPEGQTEIPRDNAFPMNTNIDIMDGIDFKKGCYVGQELTIRTHHTGVVRRRIFPVALYDPESPAPSRLQYDPATSFSEPSLDTDIKAINKRGKPGKWIAGVGNVGLAMCRVEMMTDLVVTGEPSSFSADDQFVIEAPVGDDSQNLGVKAFVPDWIRGKVRPPKTQKRV
ncbi:hypothetical protein AAFC00_000621 [Neodothiora populina]|uniref:Iron-sulfur cluster assembly factor IBA57 homolog, mitochondrial n=1 Tax=Neodothiora populina TaxID=2781224 RepID=A0ABR3PDG7_9PEZI